MHILHINNITVNFAGRELYRDLSWVIGDRDRIGLVGPNGAGKSTLFKVILGEVEPDKGNISLQTGIRVGYLEQDIHLPSQKPPPKPPCLLGKQESQCVADFGLNLDLLY